MEATPDGYVLTPLLLRARELFKTVEEAAERWELRGLEEMEAAPQINRHKGLMSQQVRRRTYDLRQAKQALSCAL